MHLHFSWGPDTLYAYTCFYPPLFYTELHCNDGSVMGVYRYRSCDYHQHPCSVSNNSFYYFIFYLDNSVAQVGIADAVDKAAGILDAVTVAGKAIDLPVLNVVFQVAAGGYIVAVMAVLF